MRKMFYIKYFARKLITISCNSFFTTKFENILYEKNLKQNWPEMSFFSSVNSHLNFQYYYIDICLLYTLLLVLLRIQIR